MGQINQTFKKINLNSLKNSELLWKAQFHREMIMYHTDKLRNIKDILRKKLNKEKKLKVEVY